MILGIIGLVLCFIVIPSLLALIFGIISARQIKRSGGALTGSGFARAGWIMGLIGLLAGGGLIAASASGAFDDGETGVFDLEAGDCVNFDFNPEADRHHRGHDGRGRRLRRAARSRGDVQLGELNPDEDLPYPSNEELFIEMSPCGCRGSRRMST